MPIPQPMIPNNIPIAILLFFGLGPCAAQTVNNGELVLGPGTTLSVQDGFTNSGSFINDGDAYFYGGLTNNGMLDHTAASALHLVGNDVQPIVGLQPIYAHTLSLNNSSGLENAIVLNGSISVDRLIYFEEGVIKVPNTGAALLVQDTATPTHAGPSSYVDGFVAKEVANSFVFPVGDRGYYRPMAIGRTNTDMAVYRAKYAYQDDQSPYDNTFKIGNIALFNTLEYWVLENESPGEVTVTLSWDPKTTPGSIIAEPLGAIRLVRWDVGQGAWREVPNSRVDATNQTVSAALTVDGTAVLTLGRADLDHVLPDGVMVWNAVSPNNDGQNDYLRIDNVASLPNNEVEVYNRWGALLFKTDNYDTRGNVFRGFAKGRDELLPSGTYYYVLRYDSSSAGRVEKTGFIYLSTD